MGHFVHSFCGCLAVLGLFRIDSLCLSFLSVRVVVLFLVLAPFFFGGPRVFLFGKRGFGIW